VGGFNLLLKPFSAKDKSKAERFGATLHRLILEILVAAPLVLMTVVGVTSRLRPNTFEFEEYEPAENQAISAYEPIVIASENAVKEPLVYGPTVVRPLARRWAEEARAGKLWAPRQLYADDSVDQGVKAEIFRANTLVVNAMNETALKEAATHRWDAAVEDAVLALQTTSVTRSFDVVSLERSSKLMLRSLKLLRSSMPRAQKSVRAKAARTFSRLFYGRDQLTNKMLRARTLYVVEGMANDDPMNDLIRLLRQFTLRDISDPNAKREQSRLLLLARSTESENRAILWSTLAITYRVVNSADVQIQRLVVQYLPSQGAVSPTPSNL
jgi:hypothetical protein